jgi:hypothetical protein
MGFYDYMVNIYSQFLSIFPPALQWLVTLIVVIGIIGAFISLIRHNALFIILLIILLPFLLPVFAKLLGDIYNFFLYLLQILRFTAPKT